MKKDNKKTLVDPKFARGKMYKKVIHEIAAEKVCPFCPETFKWHTKPILKHKDDWFITENFNPYKDTQFHFLIISKKHNENFSDLSFVDWESVSLLCNWAVKKYKIKGGGLTMRFGETLYTGATIKHIHFHLISPKNVRGKVKPVYFPIG